MYQNTFIKLKSGSVSDEIQKTFSGLSFNWPLFVFSLIVLMLVTVIITFLVYKPIKKMIKKRQQLIQENIDASIKAKDDALRVQEEHDKKIIEATNQATMIINNAKVESERIINSGSALAKKKTEIMLDQAEVLINKKHEEFSKQQKKIIMDNAVELAKKIIGREIKDADNIKMIKEVLDK
ncbi:ATP synthase F0 subunit B [Mycoplasma enhydrae]|uniref:F0F1 ATP synthase subunit B family protein n=1 Tax=Mycoplasma enhydrae TaxID=2499220 RepID=UPI00197B2546|nr:ATP synthase F0 subunit B [Mycoplasma enhydrae]MBN4089251.1 ATP synthase F0 subunit B [Mycoplasma enhydrae]MCV3733589.1 ATP synthase F0 subunit B [Mycoplasma enhydrae]MCV3753435.1 ATP synthase F0 subunit B [Mycoplasma enhydrae]